MFELRKVSFGYDKKKVVLKEIDLKIKKGCIYVIVGENGSGKSTLLMILKGINTPKSGEMLFKGEKIISQKERYLNDVGYVFQNPDTQIIGMDVWSDIEIGPINLGWDREKIDREVITAMELCNVRHLKDKTPNTLSYGEKKRVSIAAVLAMDPEVIIFDEPTTWLDPYHKNQLYKIIMEMKKRDKTVILSTHDIEFARSLNGKYLFFKNGEIVSEGGRELFDNIELMRSCRLLYEF